MLIYNILKCCYTKIHFKCYAALPEMLSSSEWVHVHQIVVFFRLVNSRFYQSRFFSLEIGLNWLHLRYFFLNWWNMFETVWSDIWKGQNILGAGSVTPSASDRALTVQPLVFSQVFNFILIAQIYLKGFNNLYSIWHVLSSDLLFR